MIFDEQEIREWRGVKGLVAAEVLTDNDTDGYTTDTPFVVAAVAEISKTRDTSSEAHYYNNIPAVIITSDAPDVVNISTSKIPLAALAKITGQRYDNTTGMFVEGERKPKPFAIGYITEDNSGAEIYVWRLKGMFNTPGQTNSTKNDGTDANGQELVYTGIQTTATFDNNVIDGEPRGAMAVNVEKEKGLVDLTHFFDTVQTPDTVHAINTYVLSIHATAGCTCAVSRLGTQLANGASISTGDILVVEWTHPDDANTYKCESITGGVATTIPYPSGSITVGNGGVAIAATLAG